MPRFAANLSMMFTEVPFPDRFERARAAGFSAVEFLFPYEHRADEVAAWSRAAGLQIVLFNLPPGDFAAGERGLAALPGREAEFRRSVDTAIDYAVRLGVPRLHAMAGLVMSGAHRDVYIGNLRHAAGRLADHRIELLIEPINRRDVPSYFLSDWEEARSVQDEVGAANLKLQCDLYHLQILHGDVIRTLERDIDRIGHIQIAGVPERHEPDEGELAYAPLFELLDRLGYAGWIGCEYRPRAGTEAGLGWFRAAQSAAPGRSIAGSAAGPPG